MERRGESRLKYLPLTSVSLDRAESHAWPVIHVFVTNRPLVLGGGSVGRKERMPRRDESCCGGNDGRENSGRRVMTVRIRIPMMMPVRTMVPVDEGHGAMSVNGRNGVVGRLGGIVLACMRAHDHSVGRR
jgi:hypothetical protein